VTAGRLLREARLRAGLSQGELGKRVGRPRTQIGRWEQDAVDPGFGTLRELLRACGFDLHSELVPYEPAEDARLEKNVLLAPERRVGRMLRDLGRRSARGG
jgi:transcriptional regulator with XRE-family HTH domain